MRVAGQLLPPRAYVTRCRVHQLDKHQWKKPGGFSMRGASMRCWVRWGYLNFSLEKKFCHFCQLTIADWGIFHLNLALPYYRR